MEKMRVLLIKLSFAFLVASPLIGQNEGIDFFEGSFEEALELAAQQDKTVFVDAFTTWCGPCKRMKKSVFPDKSVGEYYNKYFINMAIDMETQSGRAFGMKYKVSSYPTLLFIDQKGKVVLKSTGAKNIERFIDLGKTAVKTDDRSQIYATMYTDGERDFNFMVKYIKSLNKIKKPSAKIAYEYLGADHGLSDEQKAIFIFEAATSCDSKLFEKLVSKKYKKHIISYFGIQVFDQRIYDLCWATVEKGIEFEVDELIKDAKKIYKKEAKNNYKFFNLEVQLAVARTKFDASAYLDAAKKRIHLFADQNDKNDFLIEMVNIFPKNQAVQDYALTYAEKSLKKDDSLSNNQTFAHILIKNNRNQEAIPFLDRAMEIAIQEKKNAKASEINSLKKQILKRF